MDGGIAAETLVFNNAEGGSDDKNKLIGVLTILGFSESVYQQKLRFHALQAKTLLQENWSSYEALVNAMRQRTSVEDCHAELGVRSRSRGRIRSEKLSALSSSFSQ